MDAIARELGMSKRTLYARFGSKEELFKAVIAHVLANPIHALSGWSPPTGTLEEQLHEVAGKLLYLGLHPDMIGLEREVMASARMFPGEAVLLYHAVSEYALNAVKNILTTHLGQRRSVGEIDLDASIFLAMTLLPPLRSAALGARDEAPVSREKAMLDRSISIFVSALG